MGLENFASPFMAKLLLLSLKAALTAGCIFALRALFITRRKARYAGLFWCALILQLALPLEIRTGWSAFGPARALERGLSGLIAGAPQDAAPGLRTAAAPEAEAAGGNGAPPMTAAAFALWISGAAAFLTRAALTRRRFSRATADAVDIGEPEVLEALGKAGRAMKVSFPVRLLQSAGVTTPCARGFLRRAILLPAGSTERFNAMELECIFLHELAHFKRGDLLLEAVITLLQAAHWFNPVLTLAFRAMRRDREYACDAAAMAVLEGDGPRRFGAALLHALERFTLSPSPQCALGKMESKTHLRRRILMISSFDKKPLRRYPAAAVVFAAATLAFGSLAAGAQEARRILFQPPVSGAKITLEFGWAGNPLKEKGETYFHKGMDAAMPVGTPLSAVADGKVESVSQDDTMGKYLVIRHADGFASLYAKMSRIDVKPGQEVKAGQAIGLSGNTGIGTGPHLHFALKKNNAPVDPREYILF